MLKIQRQKRREKKDEEKKHERGERLVRIRRVEIRNWKRV